MARVVESRPASCWPAATTASQSAVFGLGVTLVSTSPGSPVCVDQGTISCGVRANVKTAASDLAGLPAISVRAASTADVSASPRMLLLESIRTAIESGRRSCGDGADARVDGHAVLGDHDVARSRVRRQREHQLAVRELGVGREREGQPVGAGGR